ncbi:hypothetical protein ACFE04_007171 [Oxalis oulophora]
MALSAEEMAPLIESQRTIWGLLLAFADSMAIKSAVELRLADIIQAHDCPVTLSQIASAIDSPTPPNTDYLRRIMRYLVNKKIFSVVANDCDEEILYGPTPLSKMISNEFELSLAVAPMILFQTHPQTQASWHYFSKCVKYGGAAFRTAHGCDAWELASKDDDFNKLVNNGMACSSNMLVAIVAQYEGFKTIESLVDVGGGTGTLLASIVKEHPNIKAINFDLPHVIASAPEIPGINHVGGNMFETVPAGEAIILKWIIHDWPDKECIKILKNCWKAIPENGKVIMIDIVLKQKEDGSYCDYGLKFDLIMFAHTTGKERTEQEWKHILNEGGFTRYKIIPDILLSTCIIEACP